MFEIQNHHSIFLIVPQDEPCREWLEAHTEGQWFYGGLVVEPRYVEDLVGGMLEAGFQPTH